MTRAATPEEIADHDRDHRKHDLQGEFSVCQFFEDGSYEYVRRFVDPKTAVEVAHHYCHSVAAQTGITRRVIITDGGDSTNFEWRYGEGIVFPPRDAAGVFHE